MQGVGDGNIMPGSKESSPVDRDQMQITAHFDAFLRQMAVREIVRRRRQA